MGPITGRGNSKGYKEEKTQEFDGPEGPRLSTLHYKDHFSFMWCVKHQNPKSPASIIAAKRILFHHRNLDVENTSISSNGNTSIGWRYSNRISHTGSP